MEEMLIPLEIPMVKDKIEIQIWDNDVAYDDICGSFDLNASSLLKYGPDKEQKSRMKWINMYGSTPGQNNKYSKIMNRDSKQASTWTGRILIEFYSKDVKYPKLMINRSFDPNYGLIQNYLSTKKYKIYCEFRRVACLQDDETYNLEIVIADYKNNTIKLKPRAKDDYQNYIRWDAEF